MGSKKITAKVTSVPGVSAAAREAKAKGLKRFQWECSVHGMVDYYVSSKACPCCTVDRKDKNHQRAYNAAVKDRYPYVKREDGSWTRKKVE